MSSRPVLALGLAAAVVLSVLTVLGVALEQWVLAAAALSLLVSATLLVQLDSWRRLRGLSAEAARRSRSTTPPPPVADGDSVALVQLMQAQYTGRLDRMQRSLDEALQRLSEPTSDGDVHGRVAVEHDP